MDAAAISETVGLGIEDGTLFIGGTAYGGLGASMAADGDVNGDVWDDVTIGETLGSGALHLDT